MATTGIIVGTRGSTLALRQTQLVVDALKAAHPALDIDVRVITTTGDRITDVPLTQMGEAGVFTSGLEVALRAGEIDLAVHSVKDLPVESPAGVMLGAIPPRANPADVLISRAAYTLATLPQSAHVGTSSRRRAAQLRRQRPDAQHIDIRGNVDTRIQKAHAPDGDYDAIILAHAGLERLGRLDVVSEILPLDIMLPAPGQAALGVQCRDESRWLELLAPIHHLETAIAISAERAFLAGMGGGCALPIAAYGEVTANRLTLRGRVIAPDGSAQVDVADTFTLEALTVDAGQRAGESLAAVARSQGAERLLQHV